MTATKANVNRWAGRLVILGMVSLFLAMLCAIGSFAMLARGPGGGVALMNFAKIFGFLWLPLIGLGALIRVANNAQDEKAGADGMSPSTEPSAESDSVPRPSASE